MEKNICNNILPWVKKYLSLEEGAFLWINYKMEWIVQLKYFTSEISRISVDEGGDSVTAMHNENLSQAFGLGFDYISQMMFD